MANQKATAKELRDLLLKQEKVTYTTDDKLKDKMRIEKELKKALQEAEDFSRKKSSELYGTRKPNHKKHRSNSNFETNKDFYVGLNCCSIPMVETVRVGGLKAVTYEQTTTKTAFLGKKKEQELFQGEKVAIDDKAFVVRLFKGNKMEEEHFFSSRKVAQEHYQQYVSEFKQK